MLLFVDESGHDHGAMPCEVLAGAAIAEESLWNVVRAIRSLERDHFGDYLRILRPREVKAKQLLKRKRFASANRPITISEGELKSLAERALRKGVDARIAGREHSDATQLEIVGYSRSVLKFVHSILDVAAQHDVRFFATVVDRNAPRPEPGFLRKDYVYLFERYFYFLETLPTRERGLIVFDELEKTQAHILVQQMAAYFLGTDKGRFRSSRVVPEPFFVHSDLTTGVFLADLAAYILGWGWRLTNMPQPSRPELKPYADKLHQLQFKGETPNSESERCWPIWGFTYLDDLRGQSQKR